MEGWKLKRKIENCDRKMKKFLDPIFHNIFKNKINIHGVEVLGAKAFIIENFLENHRKLWELMKTY